MTNKHHPDIGDWLTAHALAERFGTTGKTLKATLEMLQGQLIAEHERKEHSSHSEAKRWVEDNALGIRIGKNKHPVLAIAPNYVDRIPYTPDLEDDWKTANTMRWEGKQPRAADCQKKYDEMARLRRTLIDETASTMGGKKHVNEATHLIDNHLLGDRRPARGPSTLAASPDAQRIMDDAESSWAIAEKARRESAPLGRPPKK